MAQLIAEFFGIIGADILPPENMRELIPYIFTVVIGVFLVAAVFKVIAAIATALMSMRKNL